MNAGISVVFCFSVVCKQIVTPLSMRAHDANTSLVWYVRIVVQRLMLVDEIFSFRMIFVSRCTMERRQIETQSERPRAGRDTKQSAGFARDRLGGLIRNRLGSQGRDLQRENATGRG